MIRVYIDSEPFYVHEEFSALDALTLVGIRMPRFCYHEALSVPGNCRICLVEIHLKAGVKIVTSCTFPLASEKDVEVFTNSITAVKGRENVMESLLLNHPLDCPICDQAGECDLQDHSRMFGGSLTRFLFSKRGVFNKYIDPCIKTIMTRCIHCTRCVRYAIEITNSQHLGTIGRGGRTEIGTFIKYSKVSSESSGNVVDLCPVGALTPKPYAFKSRPWEVNVIESLDLYDGLGSPIYINLKELVVVNVLPKPNNDFFGEWISNKTRFAIDSNNHFRVLTNYKLEEPLNTSLLDEFSSVNNNKAKTFICVVNEEINTASLINLSHINKIRRNSLKLYRNPTPIKNSNVYLNIFNNKKELCEDLRVTHLFFATAIRMECANLNTLLRRKTRYLFGTYYHIGFRQQLDNTPSSVCLNVPINYINSILLGKDNQFSILLYHMLNSVVIFVGDSLLQRLNITKLVFLQTLSSVNNTHYCTFVNQQANSETISHLGIRSLPYKKIKGNKDHNTLIMYNLEDTLEIRRMSAESKVPQVWSNSHSSSYFIKNCVYNMPAFTNYEKEGLFVNLEKRPQKAAHISHLSSLHPTDKFLNIDEFFMALLHIRNTSVVPYKNMFEYINELIQDYDLFESIKLTHLNSLKYNHKLDITTYSKYPFKPVITNFFVSNNNAMYSIFMEQYSYVSKKIHNIFAKQFIYKF